MEEGVQPAEPQFGEFKLITARSIIEGKITNQCIRLLRYQRNRPEADFKSEMDMISRTLSSFPHEKTISVLRGRRVPAPEHTIIATPGCYLISHLRDGTDARH